MNGKLWKLVAYMKCKNWSTMILLAKKAQIDEKGSTKCWIIGRKLRLAFQSHVSSLPYFGWTICNRMCQKNLARSINTIKILLSLKKMIKKRVILNTHQNLICTYTLSIHPPPFILHDSYSLLLNETSSFNKWASVVNGISCDWPMRVHFVKLLAFRFMLLNFRWKESSVP